MQKGINGGDINEDLLKIISARLTCPAAIRTRSFKLHHIPKTVTPSFTVLLVHPRNNAAWYLHLHQKYLRKFYLSQLPVIFLLKTLNVFRLFLPGGSLDSQTTETQWYNAHFDSNGSEYDSKGSDSETLSVSGHDFREFYCSYDATPVSHMCSNISYNISASPS